MAGSLITKDFVVTTSRRSEFVDITSEVEKIVSSEKIKDGICVVYVPHTTACVCINENADPSVKSDIVSALEKLIPKSGPYEHAEGNSDAHIKASIIGSSRIVLVESGSLLLGTWQGIYFCEFDGPRKRKVIIKVIGT
ncbi:MAG: secondary thiamine-phosphate synthase enzyme YjbQ [Candidatus Omnitrophota bacterium]